jgi:hypothetical protein
LTKTLQIAPSCPARECTKSETASGGLNNQIVAAVIRAVIESSDGLQLQANFEHEQTLLTYEWLVVKDYGTSPSLVLSKQGLILV